jgi:hypothetical protein
MTRANRDIHTGFVVLYGSGGVVFEENFLPDNQGRVRATNWSEIDLEDINILQLWWRGHPVVALDQPNLESFKWVFFHTGISDGKGSHIQSRSIGFETPEGRFLATVDEETGRLIDTSALTF